MAVEDKFADEVMSDEELDQVAGGNYREYMDIGIFISCNDDLRKYFPNNEADTLKKILHDHLNVDVEFNLNEGNDFDGTPNLNKYKDTKNGNSLTHNEVLGRISSYGFPDLNF